MTSSNAFARGSDQNCGNYMTGRSSTGLHAPPGGHSSICLGADDSAGATSRTTSSNAFATGSNQNCGNFISERSSTGLHAPPGGRSSLQLGDVTTASVSARNQGPPGGSALPLPGDKIDARERTISSNAFAQGSNQNCGNFLTDRPSTGLHAPPGGKSSICFGEGAVDASWKSNQNRSGNSATGRGAGVPEMKLTASSNKFATGSNQNCGNVITDRSSTRLHAPPGGHSSFVLG